MIMTSTNGQRMFDYDLHYACARQPTLAGRALLHLHGLGQLCLVSPDVPLPCLDRALVAHPDLLRHLRNPTASALTLTHFASTHLLTQVANTDNKNPKP